MTGRTLGGRVDAAAAAFFVIATFVTVGVGREASAAGGHAVQAGAKRLAVDGVYTVEQARRGREIYRKRCVLCHLDSGQGQQAVPEIPGQSLEREGDPEAPPIAGDAFLKNWNGRSARELFDKTTATMPVGGAGTLKPQEYADLIALIFELNKFPAGTQELPAERGQLELIAVGR